MSQILNYLNSLEPSEQADFAARCGTSVGYIRKAVSKGQQFGIELCVSFERESFGVVRCESLRPDVDWVYFSNRSA